MIYFNGAVFNCNPFNWGRDLGIINYMSFSYTLMPFLLAMVFQFLEGKPFSLFGRTLRHPQRLRGILIALFLDRHYCVRYTRNLFLRGRFLHLPGAFLLPAS